MKAIVKARINPVTAPIIENGSILIKGKKIIALGSNITVPTSAEIISARGKTIIPGLIDAHTHLGIDEEGLGWEGEDYNEISEPITPQLRAIDGINPADMGLASARKHGITTVMVAPGSANVLGGEAAAIKTKGMVVDQMIVKSPVGIKAAFGENPKNVYGKLDKSPITRMGIAALLREALIEAEDYRNQKAAKLKAGETIYRELKNESLLKILNKEIPLKAHAHRADDIMTAIRIAREFNLDLTIEHCTEGHLIADQIAAAGFAATVGPSLTGKSKVELKQQDFKTAAALVAAGVKIALVSDHPVTPVKNILFCAMLAVKAGLSKQEALKAVTINPAEILGIENRVGSLAVGKDADLLIFNGDPLTFASNLESVMIDGELITF
ncbi:amidohydrolase [Halanaerobium salsuginis]|jgi:imidazolonepropionase-like amidohydrolase|uniref:Imidazolonepropionase n=1 Tax=Halanaerobium salsuginis TaxID=29563 RepID=A0A1I4LFA7_9FIRM|nr:amidohydrolase [Halanaerobium salsuginis]SFL89536.1 Imidazolonepropionase [Halanaerobium salsuginis]